MLNELSVGNGIHSYEYVNDSFVELDYLMYPIFENGNLIFFAIKKLDEEGNTDMQLSEGMVEEVSTYFEATEEVAFLYDALSCYVLIGDTLVKLHDYSKEIDYRDELSSKCETSSLVRTRLVEIESIDFEYSSAKARSSSADSAMVTVDFVSQNPPSSLCWAASAVCIGNCLTDYSYTVDEIAQHVYGTSNYDREATLSQTVGVLYNKYMITYNCYSDSTVPSDSRIYGNISSGFPMLGWWQWSNGYHCTVIRGILVGTCVVVMDPEFGFITAYGENGNYSYVSSYSGVTLTLVGYGSFS